MLRLWMAALAVFFVASTAVASDRHRAPVPPAKSLSKANAAAIAKLTADLKALGGSASIKQDAAASSAAPVYLTTSNDTCMGSSGVGGQGASFGFSVGTTWTEDHCKTLKAAARLKLMGFEKASRMRLCMDPHIALAFAYADQACPDGLMKEAAALDTALLPPAPATE